MVFLSLAMSCKLRQGSNSVGLVGQMSHNSNLLRVEGTQEALHGWIDTHFC